MAPRKAVSTFVGKRSGIALDIPETEEIDDVTAAFGAAVAAAKSQKHKQKKKTPPPATKTKKTTARPRFSLNGQQVSHNSQENGGLRGKASSNKSKLVDKLIAKKSSNGSHSTDLSPVSAASPLPLPESEKKPSVEEEKKDEEADLIEQDEPSQLQVDEQDDDAKPAAEEEAPPAEEDPDDSPSPVTQPEEDVVEDKEEEAGQEVIPPPPMEEDDEDDLIPPPPPEDDDFEDDYGEPDDPMDDDEEGDDDENLIPPAPPDSPESKASQAKDSNSPKEDSAPAADEPTAETSPRVLDTPKAQTDETTTVDKEEDAEQEEDIGDASDHGLNENDITAIEEEEEQEEEVVEKPKKKKKRKDAKTIATKKKPKSALKKKKKKSKRSESGDEEESERSVTIKEPATKKRKASRFATTFPSLGIPLPREYETIPISEFKVTPPDGVRRSGRARCQPLAFWKNERLEYGPSAPSDGMPADLDMPVVKGITRSKDTPYKVRKVSLAKKPQGNKKKGKGSASGEVESTQAVPDFDTSKLRKKYHYSDAEERSLWDEHVEDISDQKAFSFKAKRDPRSLPLGSARTKSEGKVVGKASQAFNVTNGNRPEFVGYIAGDLLLPPKGIKDAESVGPCAQIFTVVDCQPMAVEAAYSDPSDETDDATFNPETATRAFLQKGDMFRIPQGNAYRLCNHSKTVDALFTWTIIRPAAIPQHYPQESPSAV